MHIGSGPGVVGLSGIHVNPFVPLRRVRMLPSDSIATTVAPFATLAGAAFMALAIRLASLGFAAFLSAASTPVTMAAQIRTLIRDFTRTGILLFFLGRVTLYLSATGDKEEDLEKV